MTPSDRGAAAVFTLLLIGFVALVLLAERAGEWWFGRG